MILLSQNAECPSRCFVCDHFTLIQDDEPVRHWDHIFQPMLTDQDGRAQLSVDAAKGLQEVCCCNGVQLAGGLVQDQHIRLQNHDGGQIQKLLLTAGELGHFHVEPGLDAEEAGHLSHSSTNCSILKAQAFQPEGKLVPDLVGDDLAVRILEDEADFFSLGTAVHLLQHSAVEQNHTLFFAVWSQNCLELPQQGRLTAAGRTGQHRKVTGM